MEWWGQLTQSVTGASTWSLNSVGRVKSPTGASVSQVSRTLTAKVPVIPTYTQPLNNPSWNFIYSRGTGQTCDMTIQQSVLVNSPLYVAGNLCLQNSSAITAGPLIVQGSLTMDQSANYAGTSTTPLNQLGVRNGCKWKNNSLHNPCQQGAGASGFDNVWATTITNNPGTSAAPAVDWDAWYLNSNPGPYYPCLDVERHPAHLRHRPRVGIRAQCGEAEQQHPDRRRFDAVVVVHLQGVFGGELSWNATTKVLTANGTIFIDGSAQVQNGSVNTYTGSATIYLSGTLLIKNSKLCQATTGSGSSMTCTTAAGTRLSACSCSWPTATARAARRRAR